VGDQVHRLPRGQLLLHQADERGNRVIGPEVKLVTDLLSRIEEHPIDVLRRLQFRVTVNTDNRLMSDVTLSSELSSLVAAFDYGWNDLEWLTINAMKSAFSPFDQRLRIINGIIKPGFALLQTP